MDFYAITENGFWLLVVMMKRSVLVVGVTLVERSFNLESTNYIEAPSYLTGSIIIAIIY